MLGQQAADLIAAGDIAIFIGPTTTDGNDRISLVRAQTVVRDVHPGYIYVEIGSELGGTLVPHLLDPSCRRAVSIDLRPQAQPDARGHMFDYSQVNTAKMIETLRPLVPAEGMAKLETFDMDARQVSAHAIGGPVDLALIDGEHTISAAFSDFVSLLPSLGPDALILFHDANLVVDAILNVERMLQYMAVPFQTYFLPSFVGAIALRGSRELANERLASLAYDRNTYIAESKKALNQMIAKAVAAGLP